MPTRYPPVAPTIRSTPEPLFANTGAPSAPTNKYVKKVVVPSVAP